MKYGFAGDRKIAVEILNLLINRGYAPSVLLIGDNDSTTHAEHLKDISELPDNCIISASKMKQAESINILKSLDLDYIFGIHFPYIISKEILNIPRIGFLNLHPAYLPYNKGWHTPSWAIYDNTPYGATLHFMAEQLDQGDIIHQKELKINPEDTADSLYQRVLDLEYKVFDEALTDLISLSPKRIEQIHDGTSHNKKDLQTIAEIELNKCYSAIDLIKKLKSLTTNNINESAYFKKDGNKYFIQIKIIKSKE